MFSPSLTVSNKQFIKSYINISFRFIFPGLALGAALGQTGVVTNAMINASAEALVELINEDDLARRATFPEIKDIRSIAAHLAMRVMKQALDEGIKVLKIRKFHQFNFYRN